MTNVNWDAIGALGEVAGAVGVVITLLYLALQIRQNTRVTRASTAQQMTNNWVLVNLEMTRNKVVNLNIDATTSADDLQIALSFWRAMFHQWCNSHYQYEYGSLDTLLFNATASEVGHYARDEAVGPNLRAAWGITRFIYNEEFQNYLNEILASNPITEGVLFSLAESETADDAAPIDDPDSA